MTQTTPAMTSADVREALEKQMNEADEEARMLPSSICRERGLTWLEGWFDIPAALASTPTPVNVDADVRVEQIHRDAAANYFAGWIDEGISVTLADECRAGVHDEDPDSLVQAFARLGLASTPAPVNVDQLREALEVLLAEARERGGGLTTGERLGCAALSMKGPEAS